MALKYSNEFYEISDGGSANRLNTDWPSVATSVKGYKLTYQSHRSCVGITVWVKTKSG